MPGPVAVTYEAGPTGFDLYRALTGAGIRCEVAAPSKLQTPSGDRVKTDAKGAARRLHHRWVKFIDRRKKNTIANVAIARELAGWCWSLAVLEE